jgi:hypothetical protein
MAPESLLGFLSHRIIGKRTDANCCLMRTSVAWIQPHPHGAIPRHISNIVISFLCSFIYYLENRLITNNLIIVRNHGDGEEDEWDINRVLERQGDAHIKVEIQSNSEFQSLTLNPTQSL